MVPLRTSMLMSSLAMTPGNRLPIPRNLTATAPACASAAGSSTVLVTRAALLLAQPRPDGVGPTLLKDLGLRQKDPRTPALGGGPRVLALADSCVLASSYGVVGTVISPLMIFSLNASSWSLMSSTWPPLVA